MGSTEINKMECDFAPTAHDDVLLPLSSSSSFIRDVSYSCGSCGYELNLNSCNRNISAIDSKYGKSMKRGVISFFSIDESRFNQINKLQLLPYFTSRSSSWRLFRRQTKLLCRNCGNYIGTVSPFQLVKSNSATWDGISACRTYDIKICSLRPLSSDESSIFI
ncbi:Uncharacterized protein Fot_20893 [Forsythia ovata]|uniref:Uncharacterized protein n=1 Tax=Forsythia ovata TaxID=205694 RepID=A0ABD1UTL5_9LAMI